MIIPDIDKMAPAQLRARSIEIHYPEFYIMLQTNYPGIPFSEQLYRYKYKLQDRPGCKVCGRPTSFVNAKIGYREYCSTKCMNSDPEKIKQVKDTCIKKYGVSAPMKSEKIKKKVVNIFREKYGVDNPLQNENIKRKVFDTIQKKYGGIGNGSEEIKKKTTDTLIKTYGDPNYNNREKCKTTTFNKYGVSHACQNIEIKDKIRQAKQSYALKKYDFLLGFTPDNFWICKCPHPKCTKCSEKYYIISPARYRGRQKDHTEPCTKLLPVAKANIKNTWPERFIQNILDQYNIQYQTNVRNIIPPQELDIYIPSHKLAIECNGVYWHDTAHKGSAYHEQKTKDCIAAGIRLIHIWEDWVVNTPEIVESMLLNRLGLSPNKIYARKCEIRDVDSKTANNFLSKNHIQGRSMASARMGLYYNDQLVSLMTFGKKRGCMGNAQNTVDGEWELVRFCSLLNTQVIGGASKLFKAFVRLYEPKIIYSFASQDISQGNVYKKLGFKCDGKITGSYWYIDPIDLRRYHRSVFTKDAIIKMGWKDTKEGWTERQVMEEQGYIRIDDAGQTKWIYTACVV